MTIIYTFLTLHKSLTNSTNKKHHNEPFIYVMGHTHIITVCLYYKNEQIFKNELNELVLLRQKKNTSELLGKCACKAIDYFVADKTQTVNFYTAHTNCPVSPNHTN